MKTQAGNTNTTLLVIILVIIVGFGVWYLTDNRDNSGNNDNAGLNLNVQVPSGDTRGDGTPEDN